MFVDDFSEEQWHDVMSLRDRVFTTPGPEEIFCTVGICMYIYFSFHARPYDHL